MLFRMPSKDLHIAAKFDPGLSRLSESRCYERYTIYEAIAIIQCKGNGEIMLGY